MSSPRTYRPVSDWGRSHFRHGKAEGLADALLAVLSERGFTVPDEVRARILDCAEPEQLDIWIRRAVTAQKIGVVFSPREVVDPA